MSAGPSAGGDLSFAEQLKMKHAEPHGATVEDVPDEDDVLHPPPSAVAAPQVSVTATNGQPVSAKAAGKQKAEDIPKPAQPTPHVLDTRSEEAFPSLGGGPKPRAAATPMWAAKKPQIPVNGANGINGDGSVSTPSTSGASTPAPTPARAAGPAPARGVIIPGKHTESLTFKTHQLLKRTELKKPLKDILRDMNRRSKAQVKMFERPDGITFEGQGPVEAVRQALKDIASQVGSKQSAKVSVPVSVLPYVIGRGGATIKEMQARSGANIQVPKTKDMPAPVDDDQEVDVTVEGDAVAAQMAVNEIKKIVEERTSTVDTRLREIPAEFYPFLATPYNKELEALQKERDVQINVPQYRTWSHQPPPQTASQDVIPDFVPHPHRHIQLSGDRHAVQDVRVEIERQVEALRREIALAELSISRGQHQFIAGPDGAGVHDLLRDTGCTVIFPPDSDDSEVLYVVGPRANIDRGLEGVMNSASSMQMLNVDVGHRNDPAHARALTRFLRQRKAIEQLEKAHGSRIVVSTRPDGPTAWELYAPENKANIRARQEIEKISKAYPPSRFRHFEMDPFFHEHLRTNHRDRIQRDHGVHLLMPSAREELAPNLILVYEGPDAALPEPSRTLPGAADIANFEKALLAAEAEILALANGHASIATREIEVPTKYQDKVRRFVRLDQQGLSSDVPALRVESLAPSSRASTEMRLRGPSDRLDELAEKVREFVEQEKRDEVERGFTLSFDFPREFARHLVGKSGENINKLRDEFDVEIQLKEDHVELRGPKAKAEACKSRIIAMSKKLEDEREYQLKVPQEYHRELIGAGGAQVKRLQDRYNVRVQFPRSAQIGDSDSIVDAGDAGPTRPGRPNQPPDVIMIRGPKKGADACRDELDSLYKYIVDTSQMGTVSVAKKHVPQIIGQGGKEMEKIRQETGARIDIPNSEEAPDASGRVKISIKGTKQQVVDAKKLLEAKAKVYDETVTRTVEVDKEHHRALIGSGGSNLRTLVVAAGGPEDTRERAKMVRFPSAESADNTIKLEGRADVVDKIRAAIEAFALAKTNETTEDMEIPPAQHRLLIGAGGETRRATEAQFGVRLDIPKQNVQGAARSRIKLTGPTASVAAAQAHINALLQQHQGESVPVPRAVHHAISNNGAFFRNLRNNHHVTVDHAGAKPPPRPSAAATRTNAAAPPLITDEAPASPDAYSWVVHDSASDLDGEIPWILKGKPDEVAAAVAQLRAAIAAASAQTSTGYLVLPDPKVYRLVIGPGGAQINRIRAASGCQVNVPKNQAQGEAIEVVGSAEGVEQAKELILEAVKGGAGGSRRSS